MYKKKLEDEVLEQMTDRPDLCDDNTHLTACIMVQQKYGAIVTPDMIRYISSIDRARRKILAKYPEMDHRTKHKVLEEEHRLYHRDN